MRASSKRRGTRSNAPSGSAAPTRPKPSMPERTHSTTEWAAARPERHPRSQYSTTRNRLTARLPMKTVLSGAVIVKAHVSTVFLFRNRVEEAPQKSWDCWILRQSSLSPRWSGRAVHGWSVQSRLLASLLFHAPLLVPFHQFFQRTNLFRTVATEALAVGFGDELRQ